MLQRWADTAIAKTSVRLVFAIPLFAVAPPVHDLAALEHDGNSAHFSSVRPTERELQAEVIERFRTRAEDGEADAQLVLGQVYETGRGVPQDFALAHMWYNIAAAHGNPFAAMLRDDLAESMSADQIAEAQRRAREWMARSEP